MRTRWFTGADAAGVKLWRQRMGTAEAKAIYKGRAATAEWVNAGARNRCCYQVRVRGRLKVLAVALWQALAHNLLRAVALRAAVRYGMAPLAVLPPGLRDEVLELCTDSSPETLSYRRDVTQRAGAFLPNGFPQAIHAPRRRMIALSGAAAAVGVLVAIMATGIVTVLALTGSHSPGSAEAGRGASSGATSALAPADTAVPSGISPDQSPGTTV